MYLFQMLLEENKEQIYILRVCIVSQQDTVSVQVSVMYAGQITSKGTSDTHSV